MWIDYDPVGASGAAIRLAREAFIHRPFYRLALDEVSPIGFDCFRYLSNRNLPGHVEAQYTSTPSQYPRLAQ
jgi:hypothetical protein